MARAEIITVAKKAADAWRNTDTYHQAAQIIDMLVSELEGEPTLTQPNEWVRVDELQEMEGQWIIIKAFDAEISGIMPAFIKDQFATTLCELGSKAIVPDLCEVHFSFNEYGKTWIAYRRPPEALNA